MKEFIDQIGGGQEMHLFIEPLREIMDLIVAVARQKTSLYMGNLRLTVTVSSRVHRQLQERDEDTVRLVERRLGRVLRQIALLTRCSRLYGNRGCGRGFRFVFGDPGADRTHGPNRRSSSGKRVSFGGGAGRYAEAFTVLRCGLDGGAARAFRRGHTRGGVGSTRSHAAIWTRRDRRDL